MIKVNGMLDSSEFIKEIEKLVNSGTNYVDAVVEYCNRNGIEIETAASIIKRSESIKSKVQQEAEDLNMLPKTSKLPGI